jgi:opacity protein-like surface antigen
MVKKSMMVAAMLMLLAPASARADWLFTPNIGTTFGGAADGREHLTYGASIGWMGAGIFGFEADLQYTPEFFEGNDSDVDFIDNSNVLTFMGNVIVGVPIGGQTGGGIRPFAVAGVGLLKTQQESTEQLFDVDNNEFGFNVGAGLMGFATDHVGFRGDVRYVRSFEEADDNITTVGIGDFDFWRANFGVTFRW